MFDPQNNFSKSRLKCSCLLISRFTYVSSKDIFIEILFHRNSSLSKLYFIENTFRRRFVFVENMFPRKYVWSKSILSEVLFNRKHFPPKRIKSLGISGSGTFRQMLISWWKLTLFCRQSNGRSFSTANFHSEPSQRPELTKISQRALYW